MPKYIVGNYYSGCVTHEVEAKDEEEAVKKGRDLPASDADLADCMHYDETLVLEKVKE